MIWLRHIIGLIHIDKIIGEVLERQHGIILIPEYLSVGWQVSIGEVHILLKSTTPIDNTHAIPIEIPIGYQWGIIRCAVYTITRWILGDSLNKVYHHDFLPWKLPNLAARMLEVTERRCKDTIAWQRCIAFLQFYQDKGQTMTYETYHDNQVEFVRAWCVLEASVGSTPPAKERRGVERPKGNLRGRLWPKSWFQ